MSAVRWAPREERLIWRWALPILGDYRKAASPHHDGIGHLAWYDEPAPHRFGSGFAAGTDVKLSQDR